mmetsp:Transcript_24263/g.52200  ORF Transcript_24263/g.52200 Transcript_24263/m.52200 type:complete len:369 (+) Transcript_24263:459-1565(+)
MIAGGHDGRGHLSNANGDGLSLGRHQHDLVVDVDAGLVPQQPRKHQLGAVANRVHSRVLHHDPLEIREQHLQRHDGAPQIRLVLEVVVHPHRVQNVVHRHHVVLLAHDARTHAAQLLHVTAHSQQEAHMNAERSHVSTSLAGDPKEDQVPLLVVLDELGLVDGSDSELALDGGDEGRSLEERASERLESFGDLRLSPLDLVVELGDADVLLSGALLRLDEPRRPVDAHDEVARDLGVQGAAVPGLLHPQHALEPSHDLVRGRVSRLVEVHHTIADVLLQWALQRGVARGDRGVMPRPHVQLVVVLQQQRPFGRIELRHGRLRLDEKIRLLLNRPQVRGLVRGLALLVLLPHIASLRALLRFPVKWQGT